MQPADLLTHMYVTLHSDCFQASAHKSKQPGSHVGSRTQAPVLQVSSHKAEQAYWRAAKASLHLD